MCIHNTGTGYSTRRNPKTQQREEAPFAGPHIRTSDSWHRNKQIIPRVQKLATQWMVCNPSTLESKIIYTLYVLQIISTLKPIPDEPYLFWLSLQPLNH